MNDKERSVAIEQQEIKLLMEDAVREQKENNKIAGELIAAVNELSGKVAQLEDKLQKPAPVKVNVDTASVEQIIRKGVTNMKIIASAKPQPIIKKVQILLFPEQDAKLFYKIVFGRWFLMLVIAFFLSCLYRFCIHWSDNQKQIKMEQLQNDSTPKEKTELHRNGNSDAKHGMDKR